MLLAFASGLIDAASYLGLGHVLTANMTGNILVLGFAIAGASGFPGPRAWCPSGIRDRRWRGRPPRPPSARLPAALTSALTGLASNLALRGGSAVLARRRLTSLCSLLGGALLGAILYLHYDTALPLAIAAAVELISVTVFARMTGSRILDPQT